MNLNSEQFVLFKHPVGLPDTSSFRLEKISMRSKLEKNEVRLHGLYYSVDPYMRDRMNATACYGEPFLLDEPIVGGVIARVVESRCSVFRVGDLVFGQLPWSTEMIVSTKLIHKIDTDVAQASEYLGVLGLTGLTAYFGLLRVGQPKAGDTVVISAAAGAVGSVAGQIAKIKGCKVIGIVGTQAKVDFLKNRLHFDEAINYHDPFQMENFKQVCPDGVDIYFDNVGGEISETVLYNMNDQGRVVSCGKISLYNSEIVPQVHPSQHLLAIRNVSIREFSVDQFKNEFSSAMKHLTEWLNEGKIESKETVVEGFHNLPKALLGLFSGENVGKMIVKATH